MSGLMSSLAGGGPQPRAKQVHLGAPDVKPEYDAVNKRWVFKVRAAVPRGALAGVAFTLVHGVAGACLLVCCIASQRTLNQLRLQ